MEELKKKLENGDISQELYDEILKRWNHEEEGTDREPGKQAEETRGRRGDTSVSGSGHFSDIVSETLRISGSGHVSGEIDVVDMKVSGSAKVEGDISVSGMLESSGSLRAEKNISAGTIDSSGSLRAGSIKAEKIDSSGSLVVEEDIEAQEMDISGRCDAESIKSDTFESSGSLKVSNLKGVSVDISGAIEAEEVECENFHMSIDSHSRNNSIEKLIAKNVKIESRRRLFTSSIEIEEIICENASLESVQAESIKANEVVIGDGCEIDYVEAKVIKTSGDAIVKEKKIIQ